MNEVWSDKIPAEVILVACDLERENAAFRAIIDATLSALPVGNVRTHTPDSIPERVGDLVKAHADELADNEQLRKDTARLDWIKHDMKFMHEIGSALCHDYWAVYYDRDWANPLGYGPTIRAAIDAAMEAGK
jgi:hypothetical protein